MKSRVSIMIVRIKLCIITKCSNITIGAEYRVLFITFLRVFQGPFTIALHILL